MGEQGFKGSTRGETEWNQWITSEKQERHKKVFQLEQDISGGREKLSVIISQQVKAEQNTERIVQQNKEVRQEMEKMVNSKAVMERNIYAYDENKEWQLSEPGALMSTKAYRDKNVLPFVEKLKDRVKGLTVKCVRLMEQVKKLTDKTKKQEYQINRLMDKVMEQREVIENLQEKVGDFGRLERYFGREKVYAVVEQAKELERAEKALIGFVYRSRSRRTIMRYVV